MFSFVPTCDFVFTVEPIFNDIGSSREEIREIEMQFFFILKTRFYYTKCTHKEYGYNTTITLNINI